MDLYYPPDSTASSRHPTIVIVAGFPDPGHQKFVGCKFKETGWCGSWGRLIAASGMVTIIYSNREPVADLEAVLRHARQNAAALRVDENRMGLMATSGNGPLGLFALMTLQPQFLKCAALCYPYTMDVDGNTGIAEAARQWGFANPTAGTTVDHISSDIPLLVVRAGQDQFAQLNESLDRFIAKALAGNLPVTFVNHAKAPHSFDLQDGGDFSREVIRQILAFMRFHLREGTPDSE
jgi:acetyl esterase/lipase